VEKSANGGDGIITTTRDLGDHYDIYIYIYSEKGRGQGMTKPFALGLIGVE
jgi:hypothetical protein